MTHRTCPFCNAHGSLVVSHGPKIYYCFSCGALGRVRYEYRDIQDLETPQQYVQPDEPDPKRPSLGRESRPYELMPRGRDWHKTPQELIAMRIQLAFVGIMVHLGIAIAVLWL